VRVNGNGTGNVSDVRHVTYIYHFLHRCSEISKRGSVQQVQMQNFRNPAFGNEHAANTAQSINIPRQFGQLFP